MVRRCSFVLCALALSCLGLCANPGDVENAQDYPGFVRPAGFIITDYDEDNPAEAEFPIAKPLPLDSDHVEQTHVRGHRYVIRYEIAEGNAPSIYQMQTYYEKVAKEAGFDVAKNGGIGDVSETFVRTSSAKDVWISLVPSGGTNVLTVVEVAHAGTSGPSESELRLVAAPATVARPADTKLPAPHLALAASTAPPPESESVLSSPGASAPSAPEPPERDEAELLYASLSKDGRTIVPFVFRPGREQLDGASQPLVDAVVEMMSKHPDLFLRIEGHTDNTGDPESNLRLSAQRALAVQAVLMSAHVDRKRLDAVGVGGLQPLTTNATAEGRERNRRIELVMWKKYPAMQHTAANSST
jgi:outer membrane protein OmpA-like peptidoglycan-associated protein